MTLNVRKSTGWFALWLLLVALVSPRTALAEATAAEKAAAEALFDQARTLMESARYSEACRKFEQSQAIDPGIGTMLYLAECYEKDGRSASAWALFREASSMARAAGQEERADQGRLRAQRLEPTLSQLTIVIEPENIVDGMVVRHGPQQLPRSIWGVAIPVDPGVHQIQVEAPGYRTWRQSVTVSENAARVSVKIPRLDSDPAGSAVSSQPPLAMPPSNPQPARDSSPETTNSLDSRRLAGYIVGGVGLVGLAVGGGFGIRALAKNNEAKDHCPGGGTRCNDQTGVDLTNDAKNAATVANIGVIGGAVLTALGVTLILTAPNDSSSTGLRLRSGVAKDGGSVSLSGAF